MFLFETKKGFSGLVVLVIIAAIGGGLFFYFDGERSEVQQLQEEEWTPEEEGVKTFQKESWETYVDAEHNFSLKHPEWLRVERIDYLPNYGSDKLNFYKTTDEGEEWRFVTAFIAEPLAAGAGNRRNLLTAQEHLNEWYGSIANEVSDHNKFTILTLDDVRIAKTTNGIQTRYLVYTKNHFIQFVINLKGRYESQNDLVIEEIIKTIILTDPSNEYIKIEYPQAPERLRG